MSNNVEEKDGLKDLPIRDLLELAKPALDNFMLLAIVDSNNSPKDCFEHTEQLGLKSLAVAVKAGVMAKIKLGPEVWIKIKQTSARPADSMLRFASSVPIGQLEPSTHRVFGKQVFDYDRWPWLLREFSLRPEGVKQYVTSLDFDGKSWPWVHDRTNDLFDFNFYGSSDTSWPVKFGNWEVRFRGRTVFWSNRGSQSFRCSISSKTILMAPQSTQESFFPKCYKVVEIKQGLPIGQGLERVRVCVRMDGQSSCSNDTLIFEKLIPLGRFSLVLSMPFYLGRPYETRPGEWIGFRLTFNEHACYEQFLSARYEYGVFEGPPKPPFTLQAPAGQDPCRELLTLAEQISAVKEPGLDVEAILGQKFLDNPPEHLHDLFIPKK